MIDAVVWIGVAVAIAGFAAVAYAVIVDLREECAHTGMHDFGWAMILAGGTLTLGGIAIRGSPLLAVLVVVTFGLLLLRRLAISRR